MPVQTPRLNLTLPDTGNQTWETDVENWANKLDEAAAQYLSIHLGGQAIDEEVIVDGLRFDETVDIKKLSLYAREAPVGAAFSVDFIKNQAEQSKTVSLADGSKIGSGSVTGLSYSNLEDFGLKVKSIGSTEPGAEISIVVHFQIQPVV